MSIFDAPPSTVAAASSRHSGRIILAAALVFLVMLAGGRYFATRDAPVDAAASATPIGFGDLYRLPVGRRGLELSPAILALEGALVRLDGYMVRQSEPAPGIFLLAPKPFVLHEHEYGPCDDLPATTVHVHLPEAARDSLAIYRPGLLSLAGTLELGNRDEADGRISTVRLRLLESGAVATTPAIGDAAGGHGDSGH